MLTGVIFGDGLGKTTPFVLDAGADDDMAAHGMSVEDHMVMVWAAQTVEQDAGNPAMVWIGAAGATASGSSMPGTGAAGSAIPACARSAMSELDV
jgi:hypothetical protein